MKDEVRLGCLIEKGTNLLVNTWYAVSIDATRYVLI